MANRSKHIHKYFRTKVGTQTIWACALSDCNHHMPPHYSHLVANKFSFCHKCNEQLVMGAVQMQMEYPICDDCLLGNDGTLSDILPSAPSIESIHEYSNKIDEDGSIIPSKLSAEEMLKKIGLDPESSRTFHRNMAKPDIKNE